MLDDLYYIGIDFMKENGVYLLIGLGISCLGLILLLHKSGKNSEIGSAIMLIGLGIMLWNGLLYLIYLLFWIGLGIFGGFFLHLMTKSEGTNEIKKENKTDRVE